MALLVAAHDAVGGEVVSGGGTGTWDINRWITELQAGSYLLMDTAYAKLELPFEAALTLAGTVDLGEPAGGYAVADVGLKALGMDHGNPSIVDPPGAKVWFCSDEHLTFGSKGPDAVDGRRPHPGRSPPTSTRPSPTTSACRSSAATRSSTPGPSTSATGNRPAPDAAPSGAICALDTLAGGATSAPDFG